MYWKLYTVYFVIFFYLSDVHDFVMWKTKPCVSFRRGRNVVTCNKIIMFVFVLYNHCSYVMVPCILIVVV
jgi:hypothetical protein